MVEVRPLHPSDDRSGFRSGNPDLDRFFLRYAGQNHFRHHVGVTYIAVDAETILGFATLSSSAIRAEDLPPTVRGHLPRYLLPVLRLARLAVDERAKGRGVGSILLRFALSLARQMVERLGCIGVVVDAKPDAAGFYEKFGFTRLEVLKGTLGDRPEATPMFLPLELVPDLYGKK